METLQVNQPKSSLMCKDVVERCSAVKLKWKQYNMCKTRPVRCITESTSHKANIPALPLGVESVKLDERVRRCESVFQFYISSAPCRPECPSSTL